MNQALDNFLSLVYPSKKLVFGFDSLKKTNPQKIKLVLLFEQASVKTKQTTITYAENSGIRVITYDATKISRFIGTKNLALISTTDANIASKILKLVKEGDTYE